jgi:crossover junction endodeoxyribonuclease RuvC
MRVLGIDPGLAIVGHAVVEEDGSTLRLIEAGVIRTSAKRSIPERLQKIYRELGKIVAEYDPEAAGVEELFFSRNVTTAISVGQARGVSLLALADVGLPIAEYSPPQVKEAITGYGNADKRQVQEMVRMLLNLPEAPRPDDAADAVAVAICYLHRARLDGLLGT